MDSTFPKASSRIEPATCLHVISTITETSAPYNEHCLGSSRDRRVTIATYHRAKLTPPPQVPYYEGNGTPWGFFRALKSALTAGNCNVVHAHSPIVGLLSLFAGRLFAPPRTSFIYTVHNSFPNFSARNKLLLLPIFGLYQKVICCGQKSLDSFPALYRWLAGRRLCAIPNGVDIDRIDRILPLTLPSPAGRGVRGEGADSTFTVVSVGRLIGVKNPAAVLHGFRRAASQSGQLRFIGDGDLREQLLRERAAAGLDHCVSFSGVIPRDDVYRQLAGADLFVSASRGEGLPVAALEAMACRCPVILSDIEPHREIADGASFIPLIAPDDIEGLAREIRRFAEMSPAARSQVARQCRSLVEERFSLGAMHAGYGKIYRQALAAA